LIACSINFVNVNAAILEISSSYFQLYMYIYKTEVW
jgi:hypothetical protein